MPTEIQKEAVELLSSLSLEASGARPFTAADDAQHFGQPHMKSVKPEIALRILVERAIIRKVVQDILAVQCEDGPAYCISVWDGEDHAIKASRDLDAIMAVIGACDEESLIVRRMRHTSTEDRAIFVGSILLVYGNDGWDVVAANTVSLEPLLEGANALAESLGDLLY